tara:strand:- start:940 stop:1890 length:951 start_codon:yes stop_codon:yes gene_type:complete
MRVIELFAGIGGFRLGLERAGHEIVFTNEWLEKPARIYEKQFGDKPNRQDIRELTADDIPNADLIVGGFPCATFSIAGKRTGLSLEDTRGTLFYEMFRLARDKRIPYILFENVKGLLNHDRGKTFEVILKVLDEMGYDAQWELLDSQNFGVPQHRERIFLVGNLRGKPRPKVFPISQSVAKNEEEDRRKPKKRKGVQTDISPTLDAHYSKGGASRPYVAQWRRGHFRDYKSDGSPTLTANMGTGGHNVPFMRIPQKKVRKFTPLECERLQGLPDNFTKYYEDGSLVSDSERYERCGRTVTIPVIEAIGKKLHESYE